MFYQSDRIAILIDGAGLFYATKALDFNIDYKKLKTEFSNRGRLLRAIYFTAIVENEDYSPLKPLADWMDYNGFSVVKKTAKEYSDSMGNRKIKGSIEIELAVKALETAHHVDHMVFFTGDGDYSPLVESIQKLGVRVSVVSTLKSQPPMISDELRRQADNFIELDDLRSTIARPEQKPNM